MGREGERTDIIPFHLYSSPSAKGTLECFSYNREHDNTHLHCASSCASPAVGWDTQQEVGVTSYYQFARSAGRVVGYAASALLLGGGGE